MRSSIWTLSIWLAALALILQGCCPIPTLTAPPVTPSQTSGTPDPEDPGARSITVISAANSGRGTLRQALLEAQPGDTIVFDPAVFPPDNPTIIALASSLPDLSEGDLTIDASQAGVIVDGSHIIARETVGFHVVSDGNTIRGLKIQGFSKAGITLEGGAQNNVIGGDPSLGNGPVGQGNWIIGESGFGVGLWGQGTSLNKVQGNLIGTDINGSAAVGSLSQAVFSDGADNNLVEENVIGGYVDYGIGLCCAANGQNTVRSNWIGIDQSGTADLTAGSWHGVLIDNSGYNVVGPDNVIANNGKAGVAVIGQGAVGNRITQNSIHNNGGQGDAFLAMGIELLGGGNNELPAPTLLDFNLQMGVLTGLACPGCTVELFSDQAEEGAISEGKALADTSGTFEFNKGSAFTGPQLTATATDPEGNTSQFSVPTPRTPERSVSLQMNAVAPRTPIQLKRSGDITENGIGGGWELSYILGLGAKHARFSINSIEWNTVDWSRPELEIDPQLDEFVSTLADNEVDLILTLSFWDKANHPTGWEEGPGYSRFKTQEEIDRYLEFVQLMVDHFKDRVQYYELWNEPDNQGFPVQNIAIPDYINLVQQAVPVIRSEYPAAKIVVGSVSNLQYSEGYLRQMLAANAIMPLVDVVSWHPFYGASPSYGASAQYGDPAAYYSGYPTLAQELMALAEANGFDGEYWVSEVGWPTPEIANPDQPWIYSPHVAAKYYGRGVLMHLGMGFEIEAGSMTPALVTPYATVHNLGTVMEGAEPTTIPFEIVSMGTNISSYSFSLTDGEELLALWFDGPAAEGEMEIPAEVRLAGYGGRSITGIDILLGYEQPLNVRQIRGDSIIPDLLIKDYPILLRISP